MKGMELTRLYARETAIPALRGALGEELFSHLALGSVGEGSDRFGFDDDVSRDHDWGVSLVVWIPHGEDGLRAQIQHALAGRSFQHGDIPVLGFVDACPSGRAGVMSVEDHYRRFTSCPEGPTTLAEWRAVSESDLAACTNGDVFVDGPGTFTALRARLLEGYPHAVRFERIARRMFQFSQAGQYNLVRALVRRDEAGAALAFARAHEAACMLAHALDRRYCPYYKWMQASLEQGSPFARAIASALSHLIGPDGPLASSDAALAREQMDGLASLFVGELQRQEIITGDSLFLLDHVDDVRAMAHAAGAVRDSYTG